VIRPRVVDESILSRLLSHLQVKGSTRKRRERKFGERAGGAVKTQLNMGTNRPNEVTRSRGNGEKKVCKERETLIGRERERADGKKTPMGRKVKLRSFAGPESHIRGGEDNLGWDS